MGNTGTNRLAEVIMSLVLQKLCHRYSLDQTNPETVLWAQIGMRLASETPEYKEIFGKRRARGRPKKLVEIDPHGPISKNESIHVQRAKLIDQASQNFPGLSLSDWIDEIEALKKENDVAKKLFRPPRETLMQSISRGRSELQKSRTELIAIEASKAKE